MIECNLSTSYITSTYSQAKFLSLQRFFPQINYVDSKFYFETFPIAILRFIQFSTEHAAAQHFKSQTHHVSRHFASSDVVVH